MRDEERGVRKEERGALRFSRRRSNKFVERRDYGRETLRGTALGIHRTAWAIYHRDSGV